MPLGGESSIGERWLLHYGEWLSTGILVAVVLILFPEPPAPKSPQASLVHCAFPLLEPRVSGYNQNCVCWVFRGSLRLQSFLTGRQKRCCFSQLDVIWVPFQLWFCRLGYPSWGLDPTLIRGKHPGHWNIPQNFSCCSWELRQPSHTSSTLPTYLVVVKWFLLSVPGFKASLQLLLFRMISVQFICNSRLVLGGS